MEIVWSILSICMNTRSVTNLQNSDSRGCAVPAVPAHMVGYGCTASYWSHWYCVWERNHKQYISPHDRIPYFFSIACKVFEKWYVNAKFPTCQYGQWCSAGQTEPWGKFQTLMPHSDPANPASDTQHNRAFTIHTTDQSKSTILTCNGLTLML